MSEAAQEKWIAGFWRRIGAFFIDSLLLGLVGFILGLALESTFVELGSWGRLIGFTIALMYFGVMNSNVFKGQTIGKRILNLRVVNSENQTIALGRSIVRYVVFATPFSLNGLQLSNEAMLSLWMYPLSFVVFGGLFAIVYLYLFNRVTRQSLHDLAVGTYVVNAKAEHQEVGEVWRVHLAIVALLFVIAVIGPAFTSKLAQSEPFKEMFLVQTALTAEPEVSYATLSRNTTTVTSANHGTKTTTYVSAQVFISSNNGSDDELARRMAKIVIAHYPKAGNEDVLRVVLTYGYDIGIWSQWSNHTHDFSPGDLQDVE